MKEKKARKNLFIIEGYKMIVEAINEDQKIDLIVMNENWVFKSPNHWVAETQYGISHSSVPL